MRKLLLLAAFIGAPLPVLAASEQYAVICTSTCTTQDANGNTVSHPAGYVINRIMIDPTVEPTLPVPQGYEYKADPKGTAPIGSTVAP